jgi:hypothetical protein
MDAKKESQTQELKETTEEIYIPKQEWSCDLHDKECNKRYFEVVGDCV